MGKQFLYLLFSLAIFSCQEKTLEKEITPSIYHWKTVYSPTSQSLERLQSLNIQKQYIRFFDVDFDANAKKALPKAIVKFNQKPKGEVVPVVFLTNRTFGNATFKESEELGPLLFHKIKSIAEEKNLTFSEIQLDCDWSKSTQEKYFTFLEAVKSEAGKSISLSATIRLHQVKFREQTGIPPVKRGTLMLYNVGDWTNIETKNSLFDPEIIDQYIGRISEYPLPLDLALPIYSQTIIYRGNQFLTYRKNISKKELEENSALRTTEKPNHFICTKDSTFYEQSFRKGDVFRCEEVDIKTLNQVKNAVLERIQNKALELQLFHLDHKSFASFNDSEMRAILNE